MFFFLSQTRKNSIFVPLDPSGNEFSEVQFTYTKHLITSLDRATYATASVVSHTIWNLIHARDECHVSGVCIFAATEALTRFITVRMIHNYGPCERCNLSSF